MPWKRIYKGLDTAKAKQFDTSELAVKQLSSDLVDALHVQDSRYIIVRTLSTCLPYVPRVKHSPLHVYN